MALTKKDKEEITKIVRQIIGESQTINGGASIIESGYDLEQLDKKWRDGGTEFTNLDGEGLILASEDVVLPNGKKYFTWEEAMALEKEGKIPEGWRLPTMQEWTVLATRHGFRINEDGSGEESGQFLEEDLGLSYNGCVYAYDMDGYNDNPEDSGAVNYVGETGNYWSASATTSASDAFFLHFYSGGVYPQDSGSKYYGFSVRCVAERR